MKVHCLRAIADQLPELAVTPDLDSETGLKALKALGMFNGCMVGLVHYSGETAWERHSGGDELLYILEGEAELTALIGDGRVTVRASAGDLVEIPKGIWHSQVTMAPVKLLFITHAAGSESSKNPLGT